MEEASEEATPEAPDRATPIGKDHRSKSRADSVQDRQPQPVDNVVERQIGGRIFKMGRLLSEEEQDEVAAVISRHLDAFAWAASDMPGIDPYFLCHHLTMDAKVRPVRQRRRKFNEERCLVVKEETQKLLSVGHIREIQYLEWLANVVLVKKANGKWRMCVDFTDLNKVMPFGLKNAGATYQRLMDKVLAPMIGWNVHAYVDDMVVTSQERGRHPHDLEELFATIAKYRVKLNPEKCVFGVEAGKILGFMLTERGIEGNPDKCAAIIAMRSPTSVKEVQQLTGRMAALSQFVSAGGEKGHPYFQCLNRNSHFAWTDECEATFLKLKEYLAPPPVLCKPRAGVPLRLYFAVTEWAISSVLVQEQDQVQRPIYFALRFAFKASNNQAEYEALIVGMLLAKEMGAQSLLVKRDSQLVAGQVTEEYQAKDLQMAAYLKYVQVLKGAFTTFELMHVPREQNARADLLAKLAISGKGGRQRTVIQETLKMPRKFVADNRVDVLHISAARGKPRSHRSLIQDTARTPRISTYAASSEGEKCAQVCALEEGDTWMTPYRRYIADGILPAEPGEGKRIKRNFARYTLIDGVLFRHGFTHPILTCVSGDECTRIMSELHEGICGSHVGGRSLASRVIRAGFYWPSVREDCVRYA
ncbi:uncharacterized protein [Phaseolus vulgaris]|uniref:uncharacterized protein n=1 Tax=Phaseolus vulgaris TaxID=3885 RepID=UPI0035CAD5EE